MSPANETMQLLHTPPKIVGVRVGELVAVRDGVIHVDFEGNAVGPLRARRSRGVTLEELEEASRESRPVLIAFERQDPARPIVFDIVETDRPPMGARPSLAEVSERSPIPAPAVNPIPDAGVRVGRIVSATDGRVEVDFDGNQQGPRSARSTVPLRNLKDPVLLILSTDGEPIIAGQLYARVTLEPPGSPDADVVLHGRRVRIEAETELVLTAGSCAVTLDARGRAVTTADQVVSRARGANKILGGSIQLN